MAKKNPTHSTLAKRYEEVCRQITRYTRYIWIESTEIYDPWDCGDFDDWRRKQASTIKEYRWMINELTKEARELKKGIYKAQQDYNNKQNKKDNGKKV